MRFKHFIAPAIAVVSIIAVILLRNVNYYLSAAVFLTLSMLPFFIRFERRKTTAREVSLTATLIALAVVSRAAFYFIPQVKPIAAVVIVSAVCLGAERGYIIGAFSAFISNFIFGQGYWTPFQMAALGAVGLLAGILFSRERQTKRPRPYIRWRLALAGFVLAAALYGLIVDLSTILVALGDKITLSGVLSIYAAGVPFSLTFGISTAVFLFLFGEAFIKKVNRVIIKFGLKT